MRRVSLKDRPIQPKTSKDTKVEGACRYRRQIFSCRVYIPTTTLQKNLHIGPN